MAQIMSIFLAQNLSTPWGYNNMHVLLDKAEQIIMLHHSDGSLESIDA